MKRLCIFLAVLLDACVCNSQVTNTLPSGDKYIGEWKDGQPNGRGTMTSPDGAVYVGEFRNGEPNGQGVTTMADGTKYECEFKDGLPSGFGTITSPQGRKYVGQLRRGIPNGQGTSKTPDGQLYTGEFKDGQPDGQGSVTASNGTNQRGEWRGGKEYRVSGTWVALDGTREEGTWNTDGSQNSGTITWKDGREYKGDWKLAYGSAELPEGTGTMTWPDGRKYVGQFKDGKMEGTGKMTYPDGKVADGLWKDDKFAGTSTSPASTETLPAFDRDLLHSFETNTFEAFTNSPVRDELKVRYALALSGFWLTGHDCKTAGAYNKFAIENAKKYGMKNEEAQGVMGSAMLAEATNDVSTALVKISKAIVLFKESGSKRLVCDAMWLQARMQHESGMKAESLMTYKQVQSLVEGPEAEFIKDACQSKIDELNAEQGGTNAEKTNAQPGVAENTGSRLRP